MMNRAVSLSIFLFVLLSLWLKVSDGDDVSRDIFAEIKHQKTIAERFPASIGAEEARY